MKSRLLFAFISFIAISALSACHDDDSDRKNDDPGKIVESAFWSKYPQATRVKWEKKGNLREADFVLNGRDYEAWFNASGTWLQAEYSLPYTAIPSAVKELITNNINYPPTRWTPDQSVEVLERKNYPDWYIVELENGANEVTIWSDAEGYRSMEVAEDYSGNDIPQAIRSFMASTYSQGYIYEVEELVGGGYEANLLDGNEAKQVYFDRTMSWLYTEWPVLLAEVPEVVQAVLNTPAYQDFTVRNVSYQQYAKGDRYHFILKSKTLPAADIRLDVDLNGNIILD